MKRKDFVGILDLAIKALNICNNIHERTGAKKVPLDDVANEMGNDVTKEDIQDGFWVLVEMDVIGDDGDYDHMNYDGGNELTHLLEDIKIDELSKDQEAEIFNPSLTTKRSF